MLAIFAKIARMFAQASQEDEEDEDFMDDPEHPNYWMDDELPEVRDEERQS